MVDGVLKTWAVAELAGPANAAGSDTEPGKVDPAPPLPLTDRVVAGRSRQDSTLSHQAPLLCKQIGIRCSAEGQVESLYMQACAFSLFPNRPNHCLVGTNSVLILMPRPSQLILQGAIVRQVRFGQRASPRQYACTGQSGAAMSIEFSPSSPEHFLAVRPMIHNPDSHRVTLMAR